MSLQNKVSIIYPVIMGVVIFSLFSFLIYGGFDLLEKKLNIVVTDNLTNRLMFFVNIENSNLNNISERELVLNKALNLFANKPFFGNGFASTRLWGYRVGPHNTFVSNWADYGIMGILIIPSFLIASTYSMFKTDNKEYRNMAFLFIIYYVFSSMFSHNMLEQGFNMAGAIIVATIGDKKKNYKINDFL